MFDIPFVIRRNIQKWTSELPITLYTCGRVLTRAMLWWHWLTTWAVTETSLVQQMRQGSHHEPRLQCLWSVLLTAVTCICNGYICVAWWVGLVSVGLVVERHGGWDWWMLDLWLRGMVGGTGECWTCGWEAWWVGLVSVGLVVERL